MNSHPLSNDPHIRPLQSPKDLTAVAAIIETCFSDTLDEEGYNFVRQLREAAAWQNREQVPYPLNGFVWEEAGQIAGNLSLIPFLYRLQPYMLIANVAVYPEHRNHGIAEALTLHSLESCRKNGFQEVWLQVRDDNPAAQRLYQKLGFISVIQRDTWTLEPAPARDSSPADNTADNTHEISLRTNQDWPVQKNWLEAIYPPDICWNLQFDIPRLQPGLISRIKQWLKNKDQEHWCTHQEGTPKGFATLEKGNSYKDFLWLAMENPSDISVTHALLQHLREDYDITRPLQINFPAFQSRAAFEKHGFYCNHSLIWMKRLLY